MFTVSPASSNAGRRLSTDLEHARPSSVGEEELQLQLALAMSKEEHEEEVRKQKSDDIKLQMAIDESRRHADDEVSRGNISQNQHDSVCADCLWKSL